MDGVAEGIEDGGHIRVEFRWMHPDVGGRHREVLAEGAVDVVADSPGPLAQVTFPRQAGAAPPAHVMPLTGDELPDLQVGDGRTEFDDGATELMPQDAWSDDRPGGPAVPAVDVHVGAADSGTPDPYQDLGGAGGRDGNVDKLQAWAGVRLREGQHGTIVPQGLHASDPGWSHRCRSGGHPGRWCNHPTNHHGRPGLSAQLVVQGVDGVLRGEQIGSGHFPVTLDGEKPLVLAEQRHQFLAFRGVKATGWLLLELVT